MKTTAYGRGLAKQVDHLERAADKVAATFDQLYRVTDLLYAVMSQLRETSRAAADAAAAERAARRRRANRRRPGRKAAR